MMLNKRRQTQKSHILHGFMYMKCPEYVNLEGQKVGRGLPRTAGEVEETEGLTAKRGRVSLWGDKNVLR